MKVAIVGGTHGNEVCGVEVINILKARQIKKAQHEVTLIHGNPKAYELQKRYVDTDLNRAFGKDGIRKGYEAQRAQELEQQLKGQFDFIIDLHTTTSSMGNTVIVTSDNLVTRKAAGYLQQNISDLKIIEEEYLNDECVHLNRLAPASLTIECGPVAHNVSSARIIFSMLEIIEAFLSWDPQQAVDLSEVVYFKQYETLPFPKAGQWYIHPHVDGLDFESIQPGAPIFINADNQVITYQGDQSCYPFFINEASYREKDIAMILAEIKRGWPE